MKYPDGMFPRNFAEKEPSPNYQLRLLFILVVSIFFAEVLAMIVIFYVRVGQYWLETLLDASIMVLFIVPVLYFFHFRPLSLEMAERKRSERLLVNVLESLPVGVWIINRDGGILHGNPASIDIWAGAKYGGTDSYAEYKAWWLDSGEPVEASEWAASRSLQQGVSILDEEVEIECFDGSRKIILNSSTPIYEQGEIQGAIVVNQDITERKLAEASLAKSEALFKTAFQVLPVGAWITDETGKIILSNPAGREIWAGARYIGTEQFGEYIGWWLSTGQRIAAEDWAISRAIRNGETSINEEIEIECFDGAHKIILNSAIPVRDEQAQLHGVFVVNEDITQRKQYEEALIQKNELIQKVFNSIDVLIAYMDRDFNFIEVNEAYAQAGGQSLEFYPGKYIFDLFPSIENEVIFKRVVETGIPYTITEQPYPQVASLEGDASYWNWSLQPVRAADGSVQWVVLSSIDVTERKRAEILLELQNKHLNELRIAESKQRQLAETLNEVSLALSQSLNFDKVMDTLLEYVCRLVPVDRAYIVVAEDETNLKLQATYGYDQEGGSIRAVDPSNDIFDKKYLYEVISNGKTLLIPDTQDYPGWKTLLTQESIRCWLGIPINAGSQTIGVLALAATQANHFTQEHLRLSEAIATQASVAIQNSWLFEQVRAGHERMKSLSRRLVEVQENERRYIAQELHDEASQSLTALIFGLRLLEQDAHNPEKIVQQVEELKKLTDGVLEELHRLAMGLRPVSLDYLGLVSAVEQLVKDTDKRYNLNVRFRASGLSADMRLPEHFETGIYRVIQEALTNAIRHARANSIDVILELCEGKIIAVVEDDGVGFDPSQPYKSGHLGLVGMQERAQMMSGTLHVESFPGSRTTIVLEAPYDEAYPDRR